MINKPIVIAGATASGKTDFALELCRLINGEIISADSRQVYKYLTAGTAKPEGACVNGVYTVEGVAYHMVDFLEPEAVFNAGEFAKKAKELEAEIFAKGKIPVITGGTGMWIQTYLSGMDSLPPADEEIRRKLKKSAEENGKEFLHKELERADPVSAAEIPPGNIQRVMRALEIYLITGKKASELRTGKFNAGISEKAFFIYLNRDKEDLSKRIVLRTENIFDGMAAEAKELLARGYSSEAPALKSLGYPQAIEFLQGGITRAQAVEKIIILTRQYAKRQRTWFNRYKNIEAIDPAVTSPQDIFNMHSFSK